MANMNSGMTLYDISKAIIDGQKPLDLIKFNKIITDICKKMIKYDYLMLYCKENSDFTIFKITNDNLQAFEKDLNETISNRGQVINIEEQNDGAWEFWIKDLATEESLCYYLFDYTNAVIEIL